MLYPPLDGELLGTKMPHFSQLRLTCLTGYIGTCPISTPNRPDAADEMSLFKLLMIFCIWSLSNALLLNGVFACDVFFVSLSWSFIFACVWRGLLPSHLNGPHAAKCKH